MNQEEIEELKNEYIKVRNERDDIITFLKDMHPVKLPFVMDGKLIFNFECLVNHDTYAQFKDEIEKHKPE